MIPSNKKTKRISFLLNEDIYRSIKFIADKQGIQISKLLRSLLNKNFKYSKKSDFLNERSKLITFRLASQEYKDLINKLDKYKISPSQYFRFIAYDLVNSNVNPNKIIKNLNDNERIPELWQSGRLNEVIQVVENSNTNEEIEPLYLIYYARAYAEFGFLKKAEEILNNINQKNLDLNTSAMYEIALIDMALNSRRVNEAVLRLNNFSKEYLTKTNSRNLKALHLCQLGEMLSANEDDQNANVLFEQALDYVDIVNYPLTVSRLYLRLGRINLFLGNYKDSEKFYNRSDFVNQKKDNKVYKAWYYFDKSTLSYMSKNDIDSSNEYIAKALDIYKKMGHTRGIYYSRDSIGRINLSKDNYNEAYKYFKEAETMEKSIRGGNSFSHTKFFRLFIEAKHKYDEVIQSMEHDLKKAETFRPTSTQYIYYETLLQNGNEADRQKGLEGLRKIIVESKSPLITNVAKKSLESGKFEVFR
jgi:tetratricopeptide (TPR) repeat protein